MVPRGTALRASRRSARCLRTSSMLAWILPTRSRIRRRSVSSFFSPGPRTPIRPAPPPAPPAPPPPLLPPRRDIAVAGMARKNIEDQLRAIDYPALRRFFNVALLHGREVAVEDDQRRFVRGGFTANLIELAAAHQRCGIRGIAHLEDGSSDLRSRAARQLDQLRKGFAALLARGHAGKAGRALPSDAYEQGALCCRDLVLRFGH